MSEQGEGSNKRGGVRAGAGRKPGGGAFGEPTVPVRVPQSQAPLVLDWLAHFKRRRESGLIAGDRAGEVRPVQAGPAQTVPLFASRVPAGFPSPADDYVDRGIDLNEHLIIHRDSTFILRVSGWSMRDAGIFDGDEIIVDRALPPRDGAVVVAVVDGELTVKRLRRGPDGVRLCAENPDYPDLVFRDGQEVTIWGVVTRALHRL